MTFRAATLVALLGPSLFGLTGCGSDMLTTEPAGGSLGRGEAVLVDDQRCPAGQVSKVTGPASLTAQRTYACVPKSGGGLF